MTTNNTKKESKLEHHLWIQEKSKQQIEQRHGLLLTNYRDLMQKVSILEEELEDKNVIIDMYKRHYALHDDKKII